MTPKPSPKRTPPRPDSMLELERYVAHCLNNYDPPRPLARLRNNPLFWLVSAVIVWCAIFAAVCWLASLLSVEF